jgi:hypothetical protein
MKPAVIVGATLAMLAGLGAGRLAAQDYGWATPGSTTSSGVGQVVGAGGAGSASMISSLGQGGASGAAPAYSAPLGLPGFTYGGRAAAMLALGSGNEAGGMYPPGAYAPSGGPGDAAGTQPGYAAAAGDDSPEPAECATRLTVSGGAVFLHRSLAPHELLVQDYMSGNTLLDAHNLGLQWAAGPRIDAILSLDERWDAELVYFGITDWRTSQSFTGSDIDPLNVPGLNSTFLVQDATVRYLSDLYSGELNLRDKLSEHITLLAGFRYLSLRDKIVLSGDSTVSPNEGTAVVAAQTMNNLYGFQIGADVAMPQIVDRLTINGSVKAGIYGNDLDLTQTMTGTGVFSDSSFSASRGQASFVGEVALRPTYTLNGHFSIFGGYDALWLEAVALAPPHLPPTSSIHASRTAFYNGAMVGLETRW